MFHFISDLYLLYLKTFYFQREEAREAEVFKIKVEPDLRWYFLFLQHFQS